MSHYQILLKKSFIDSENQYSELNLDWIYTEHIDALNRFNELVKDEAEFVASILFSRITDEIILVRKDEGQITKLQRINLSN